MLRACLSSALSLAHHSSQNYYRCTTFLTVQNKIRYFQMARELDKDVQIMYIVPSGNFYSSSHVNVRLSSAYNRKKLPDNLEENINRIWAERLTVNPRLWNGTKFRIDSVEQLPGDGGVIFNLGITSYKDFIGTNWAPNAKELCSLGLKDHNNSQIYMSDALGVGSLVQTADNCFILLRRSRHCGEAVGLLDIPGGHPEPKEIVGKLEASEIDLASISPNDVIKEIFASTLREITDEVNIPIRCLSQPQLMGIARNTTSAGRPSSEYYTRCSLTSQEIEQRYLEGGHSEADESTHIHFIPMSKIMRLQDDKEIWDELAPSAKGCITLYQLCLCLKKQ